MPDGLEARTVIVRVVRDDDGSGRVPNDPAKRTRGALARHLLEADADPRGPEDLAPILGDRWSVEVTPPSASGERWTLTVAIPV